MKIAFYTLGCKVNQTETEYMAELLSKAGHQIVNYTDEADFYIINSCTVTSTADQKTRQHVRKFKRLHPNAKVVLTGCMPQAFPEEAKDLTQADIVLGNKNDGSIVDLINEYSKNEERIFSVSQHETGDAFCECKIDKFNDRVRAFVKIEDGCDRFCSYCIIPKSRGRVRSKSLEDLKEEINSLASNGIKEIVLVGINLSAYGKHEDFNIVDAVKICASNSNIMRVRLGSLEPDHITDEILEQLSEIDKFCPQFHISLQSGCTKTLKNMNRHYTAEEYYDLCTKIRSTFEDASITTDIMVGFHEETEEDFEESLNFVKKIKIEKAHVFPYSERKGTKASLKGDSVPKHIKDQRANIMIKETDEIRKEYFNSIINREFEVLFENEIEENIYQGYTKNYTPIRVHSQNDLIGQQIIVKITKAFDEFCEAEII